MTSTLLEDIAPYPAPTYGKARYVIRLPAKSNEENLKVELRATKNAIADSINHYSYGGSLEAKTVEGLERDYTYYVADVSDYCMRSLVRGSPAVMKRSSKPVPVCLDCDRKLLRYDSKVPIVIYAPKDVTFYYVIWHADHLIQNTSAR